MLNTESAKKKGNDKFANSVDQDEAAHNEQLHLDLHCMPHLDLHCILIWIYTVCPLKSLNTQYDKTWTKHL